jgi:hypothetical protein
MAEALMGIDTNFDVGSLGFLMQGEQPNFQNLLFQTFPYLM